MFIRAIYFALEIDGNLFSDALFDLSFILSIMLAMFVLVFLVFGIYRSFQLFSENETEKLKVEMKRLKFSLIPFYIINFIVYFSVFILVVVATRGFILFTSFVFPFLLQIGFTYLIVAGTSSYGIFYVYSRYKSNHIKVDKVIILVLLQFFFILDIVSTIIILKDKEINRIL